MSERLDVVLLRPDLFTPLARTPWAGAFIAQHIKQQLASLADIPARIGESWEFSCDPEASSVLWSSGASLVQSLQNDPEGMLGEQLARQTGATCELMVKYINSEQPLSLQVHPDDHYWHLTPQECGKPESWYVIDAEPGAGFYMGFKPGVTKEQLATQLRSGKNIESLLHFHVATPGTFFDVPPATPHALGSGITVLEPQRIRLGKSGKTYRMWDWNRRYNALGHRDDVGGVSRALHIEESLGLVTPETQEGAVLVRQLEIKPQEGTASGVAIANFNSRLGWTMTRLRFAESGGVLSLQKTAGYAVLVSLSGVFSLRGMGQPAQPQKMLGGTSAFWPHYSGHLEIEGTGELFVLSGFGTEVSWI